jgi:putative ABC transport system permease protein
MGNLWQDLKYGARMLARSPGFTLVVLLTLALGIGANTAIFSVVNAVLLRPLPFPRPDRLVLLTERTAQFPILSVSYPNYVDWKRMSHSFEALGGVQTANLTLTGVGDANRVAAQRVSANLFAMLGIRPLAGRTFRPEEDKAAGAPVALVSYGLWKRQFGGGNLLGQSITLDNKSYTVVGILPPNLTILGQSADVMVPMEPWAATLPDDRAWHVGIAPIARLKDGVTIEQARAEMNGIVEDLGKQYPLYNTLTGANVYRMQEQLAQNTRSALLVMLGAVGFVLLIGCANVANLQLARAVGRQREIAVRMAIGASRGRLLRQLLTESLLTSLCGAGLGAMLAWLATPRLLALAPNLIPLGNTVEIDGRVLAFTAAIALLAGVAFGLAPALHAARTDVRDALNETVRGSEGGMRHRKLRGALVIAEVAITMALLVGAGLLLRSFERLQNVAIGFPMEHLLVADVPVSAQTYTKPDQRLEFFDRLIERAAAIPGVEKAGAASFLPVSGRGSAIYFNIEKRPPASAQEYVIANFRAVSSNYLQTLEVPLLQGRWLSPADKENSPAVVIINHTMARTYFGDESPLGQRMQLGALPDKDSPWMEIVGVVGDIKQAPDTDSPAEMYLPFRQADAMIPVLQMSVVLRTTEAPLSEASALGSIVRDLNPNQPLVKVRTMEDNLATTIALPKFRTTLLALFAGIALLLAAIGIYSVMSYSITQRTREIGVRMALGAAPSDVLRMTLRSGILLALTGVILGAALSLALTRAIGSFLFQVSGTDAATYLAVGGLFLGIAAAACWIPARRATRVDPMVALHYE